MIFFFHYRNMIGHKGKVFALCSVWFSLIALLTLATRVDAGTLLIDEYGDQYSVASAGQVLGEGSGDGEKKEEKKEENKQEKKEDSSGGGSTSESRGNGSPGNRSSSSEASDVREKKQRLELRSPTERVKLESETRKDGTVRVKQEIRTPEGRTRIEAKDGRLEIRFKPPEGEDERDDFNEDEDEQEATGAGQPIDVVRVRERFDKNELEIRAEGSRIDIKQGRTRVRTNVPLSIGPNNELIVTTPTGSRSVAILPDTAVANLLRGGILTATADLLGQTGTAIGATGAGGVDEATSAGGEVAETEPAVTMVEEGGKLVYKVRGTKDVNFLGFFPIAAPIEANVSADTGAVTSLVQPFYLNLFSFLFR